MPTGKRWLQPTAGACITVKSAKVTAAASHLLPQIDDRRSNA